MNTQTISSAIRQAAVLVLLSIALSGCSSVEMKGTPFYTGTYGIQQGHVEDRVYVWPLLYYRESVLSALWPLFEKTDEHIALRPLFSVYGRDEAEHVYNVLWPIGQFNFQNDRHRFFPAFWGRNYFDLFPLYWHRGHPLSPEGGSDTLIPLWLYDRNPQGYNAWFAGPLFHFKYREHESGWHIGPIAGSYENYDDCYRFLMWPLYHQWSRDHNTAGGSALLPVYWSSHSREGSRFLSLLYSSGRNVSGDDRWSLLLPLYYDRLAGEARTLGTLLGGYHADRNGAAWVLIPALSGGRWTADSGDYWLFGALAHRGWTPQHTNSYVAPLFYRESDTDNSLFVSLPWSARKSSNDSWELVPPVYYHRRNKTSESRVALLYAQGRSEKNQSEWSALAPLYYRSKAPDEVFFMSPLWLAGKNRDDSWELAPPVYYHRRDKTSESRVALLYAQGRSEKSRSEWSALAPLYYRSKAPDESILATLLGGYRTDAESQRWLIYPLLSWGSQSADVSDLWLMAPFFHSRSVKNRVTQQHLIPIYYRNRDSNVFLSPLFARWKGDGDSSSMLAPPLLSFYSSSPRASDLWALAGLGHFSWGAEARSEHLLPFYYHNRESGTFLSPLFARWRGDGDSSSMLAPPLLSFYSSSPRASDLWALAGLGHFSWGAEARSEHLLPFYYRNFKTGTFVSAACMRWRNPQSETTVIPPALSWCTQRSLCSDLWLLGPIAHFSWGEDATTSHFFPFYYADARKGRFISPLYASFADAYATNRVVPPLLSAYARSGDKREFYGLLGMFYQQWGAGTPEGHLLPLYYYDGAETILTPFFGRKNTGDTQFMYPATPLLGFWRGDKTGGWLFPLFSHQGRKGRADCSGNFLWGWYRRDGRTYESSMLPFYWYHNDGAAPAPDAPASLGTYGKTFWSLPICWYHKKVDIDRAYVTPGSTAPPGQVLRKERTSHGCIPLWMYSRDSDLSSQCDERSGLFLLLFYERSSKPDAAAPNGRDERVRSHVLRWLCYYERVNNDVSVDVFPSITYDRRGDAFKKTSFLWRFFRYERGPDGRKVDLLFLPVVRQKGNAQ